MRPSLIDTAGYQPQTVEKVERLLELLAETGSHPYLGPRLRLHGGTALNIFHLSMPRLSVDADLTYVGRVPKAEYEAERPELERAMSDLGKSLGFATQTSCCTTGPRRIEAAADRSRQATSSSRRAPKSSCPGSATRLMPPRAPGRARRQRQHIGALLLRVGVLRPADVQTRDVGCLRPSAAGHEVRCDPWR
jgi:hypothetical protein